MAIALASVVWLNGRPQNTATAGVSDALTEVTAYRQDGIIEKAVPGVDVIVQQESRYYVYPSATAAADFT